MDRHAAKGCPDLEDDVVQGGELMPSLIINIT